MGKRMRVDLSVVVDLPDNVSEAQMEARAEEIGDAAGARLDGSVGVEDWYLLGGSDGD